MKKSITVFTVLFAVNTALAQDVSVGFRTGASYFNLNNEEIEDDAEHTMGLNLAVPVEVKLSPNFSIQPELNFTQKGVLFEETEAGEKVELAVKTNYVELPVLLKARFGTEKFSYYAFVAPSVGYATKRFLTERVGDGDKAKTDVEFIDEADVKSQRWELSAPGGIGASVKAGIGSVVLDVRYSLGLTDNTKFENDRPDDWEKTTNRGCTLSLGYMIPLGK